MSKNKKRLFDEDGNEVKKKPFYKKAWFCIIIFLLFAIGSTVDNSSSDEEVSVEDHKVEEVVVEETEIEEEEAEAEEEEPIEEAVAEPEPEEEAVEITPEEERQLRTSLAVSLMESSFKNTATIRYSEESDSITILPTDEDFAMAIMFLISGDIPMSEWYTLRDSFVEMSLSINENVGEGITISLLNPSNPDLTILTVVDGIVFYDAFDGI